MFQFDLFHLRCPLLIGKIVKKRIRRENTNIAEEIAIMKKLSHPNIVSLNEVIDDPNAKSAPHHLLPNATMNLYFTIFGFPPSRC